MRDLKILVEHLNQNIGKEQSAKDWSKCFPEKPPSGWGVQFSSTESSKANKCGQWLNVMAHLGFVERTATPVGPKKVRYTFKPIKEIPYKEIP